MHPLSPPPIGEPQSLGELSRLVSYSFDAISRSLEHISNRLDNQVTAEKHRADVEKLERDVADLKADVEGHRTKAIVTRRWTVGTVIAFLSTAVPSVMTMLGKG